MMAYNAGASPYSGLPEAAPYEGIEHYDYPHPTQQFNGYNYASHQVYVQHSATPNSPAPSYPPQYSELSAGQRQDPALKSGGAYSQEQSEPSSPLPWWRKHLLILCIVAVVVIGVAVGGGVGGALAAEKNKTSAKSENGTGGFLEK